MKTNVILKISAVALMAAATVLSCQKTGDTIPDASSLRTFTCTIGDPDTKLGIAEDGKTTWEVGDQILIHGEYTNAPYCETVTLAAGNISADKKTATFTLGDLTTYTRSGYSSNLYVAYPASAVVMNDHCYWNTRFSDTNQPLMVGYNKGNSFVLHNICGIITFKVSGSFDQYTLVGNNNEDVGYSALQSRIRYTTSDTENLDGFPIRTGTGDSYTTVAVKSVTASVVADGTTVNRICIPGGANFTDGFTIRFLNAGSIVKTVSVKPINVAYGKLLPLGDVTAYLKDYVAPVPPATHDSSIDMTGATALDATENANCYIVDGSVAANAEKVFTFKAYKGNSATGVGSVASAAIVWETWNNDASTVTANSVIAEVDFDKQEENDFYTMVFKMPAELHAGNAVLAAKDAGGNILWSWHIWVPETAITTVNEANFSSKLTMSRNLGALVDAVAGSPAPVGSFGLLYEWGRKDPFPGLGTATGASAATVATAPGVSFAYQSARLSIEESIQSPTTYAYSSGSWTPEATATTEDGTLWGETTKTIYDPCPVGYMLPQRGSSDFWNGTQMKDVSGFSDNSANASFVLGSLVFPLAGYIDNSSEAQKKAGLRSIVWSGRWDSGTQNAYGFYAYLDSDGPYFKRTSIARSRAGSVRCVAE